MQLLRAGLLLSCAVLTVRSADVVCGAGRTKKTVTLKAGDSANFYTSAPGTDYKKNVKCQAVFKRAKRNKCELNFSCEAFALTAANAKCKGKSDFFTLSATKKTRYCQASEVLGEEISTKKGVLVVNFRSNKRSKGGPGAVCTATCLAPGATTPSAPATTTAAPPATTAAPPATTTAAPPATTAAPTPVTGATAPPTTPPTTAGATAPPATTVPVACTNCSSVDGLPCQFPFYVNGQEYNTCTLDYTDGTEDPWCATKVDGQGSWLHGQPGSFGYCSPSCPTGATSGATACPFRETGFPASCAARHARTHKNILFLGNSYTYGNNLKSMVAGLASGAGFSATVDEKSAGGVTLAWHATNSLAKINGGDWDVVVLQDQSQRPSFGSPYALGTILPDAITLVKTIREKNPCTVPLFFQTWGKRDGDTGNCANGATALCTYEGVQDQLSQAYSSFAYYTQPARVAPAGEAWRNYSNRNSLFAGDGSHASSSGTFLAACTMFEQIWGVPSTTSTYSPVGDAAALKAQASLAVGLENWSYPSTSGSRCPSPMPVSWQCPAKPGQTVG